MQVLEPTEVTRMLSLCFTDDYSDFAGLDIRGALTALLGNLWKYGPDGFSPVRPFGNSDWQEQICNVLIDNEDAEDYDAAFALISQLIKEL